MEKMRRKWEQSEKKQKKTRGGYKERQGEMEEQRWGEKMRVFSQPEESGEERDRGSFSYSRMHLAPLRLNLIEF